MFCKNTVWFEAAADQTFSFVAVSCFYLIRNARVEVALRKTSP